LLGRLPRSLFIDLSDLGRNVRAVMMRAFDVCWCHPALDEDSPYLAGAIRKRWFCWKSRLVVRCATKLAAMKRILQRLRVRQETD